MVFVQVITSSEIKYPPSCNLQLYHVLTQHHMQFAEKTMEDTGTRRLVGHKTLRNPKSMNDIDLMRRIDIEDIEKHIGDKILAECFVLETLPL